ncbi:MAG: AtpZ/AtpI family protein [Endomicrobiia bacterium]
MIKNQPDRKIPNYLKYSNIGFQMMVIIGLGAYGGIKTDEWLKTQTPWGTIFITLFAVFTAIYLAIKDVIRDNK